MKDITAEEAVQTLKDFAMYGRYYSNNTEHHMKSSINRVLNELEKKDKIIDAMADIIEECRQNDCIESEDIDLSQIAGAKAIKQYFERKVTE